MALVIKEGSKSQKKTSDVFYGCPQRWDIENAISKT